MTSAREASRNFPGDMVVERETVLTRSNRNTRVPSQGSARQEEKKDGFGICGSVVLTCTPETSLTDTSDFRFSELLGIRARMRANVHTPTHMPRPRPARQNATRFLAEPRA